VQLRSSVCARCVLSFGLTECGDSPSTLSCCASSRTTREYASRLHLNRDWLTVTDQFQTSLRMCSPQTFTGSANLRVPFGPRTQHVAGAYNPRPRRRTRQSDSVTSTARWSSHTSLLTKNAPPGAPRGRRCDTNWETLQTDKLESTAGEPAALPRAPPRPGVMLIAPRRRRRGCVTAHKPVPTGELIHADAAAHGQRTSPGLVSGPYWR